MEWVKVQSSRFKVHSSKLEFDNEAFCEIVRRLRLVFNNDDVFYLVNVIVRK